MPENVGNAATFEELWVWKEARQLVRDVYSDFGKGRPSEYDFGFRSQIQRAAVSIMNNIAEGFERTAPAEFVRFLDIAKASSGEVRSMYYTAEDLAYVSSEVADQRRNKARAIASGVYSLQRRLKTKFEA